MNWHDNLSREEKDELYEAMCAAYQEGRINFKEFITRAASLGYTASEIYDAEKFYRPTPPENDGEESGN